MQEVKKYPFLFRSDESDFQLMIIAVPPAPSPWIVLHRVIQHIKHGTLQTTPLLRIYIFMQTIPDHQYPTIATGASSDALSIIPVHKLE